MIQYLKSGILSIKIPNSSLIYKFVAFKDKFNNIICCASPDNTEEDVEVLRFTPEKIEYFSIPNKSHYNFIKDAEMYSFPIKPVNDFFNLLSDNKITQYSYAIAIEKFITERMKIDGPELMLKDFCHSNFIDNETFDRIYRF